MTPQPRKQTTAMHILPSFSRSNDNQTKKPGHLIKPNMKNIFFFLLKNPILEKLFRDSFPKT